MDTTRLHKLAETVLAGLNAQEEYILLMSTLPLRRMRGNKTQEEMAEICDVSQSVITHMERGNFHKISLRTMCLVTITYVCLSEL